MTTPHRVIRRHPARYTARDLAHTHRVRHHRTVPQPAPPAAPQPEPQRRRRGGNKAAWFRTLLLLTLAVPGVLWALAQAPELLAFTARHGGRPVLLMGAVLALVVIGGLKQALLFRTLRSTDRPAARDD
jgi:hypothetical protein